MKPNSLKYVAKKISRLEKEYESIPPEAFLKKEAVEKKMRALLMLEKEMHWYNIKNKRRHKKEKEEHDDI